MNDIRHDRSDLQPTAGGIRELFSLAEPSDVRRGAFDRLFFTRKDGWRLPFWLMLSLSAGLATLGLSEDSVAVVIGAMVVAPLGQPIIAMGATVALAWPAQFLRLFALTLIGAVWAVALAYLIGLFLPAATPNAQILARTAPDLRDLGIALLAGAAGAYGYYRSEFSTVLSGVAIAVALVPPLCVTGLALQGGHGILAMGGALLFVTNLVGIAAAAAIVFFLTGAAHTERRRGWLLGGIVITVAATLLLLVPLTLHYDRIGSGVVRQAYQVADAVLQTAPGHPVIVGLNVDGAQLIIKLRPLPTDEGELTALRQAIQKPLGLQVVLLPQGP